MYVYMCVCLCVCLSVCVCLFLCVRVNLQGRRDLLPACINTLPGAVRPPVFGSSCGRVWWCSCRVFVCVACFSLYTPFGGGGCADAGVPLGAVPVLSWCGEVSLGGKHIIIISLSTMSLSLLVPRVCCRGRCNFLPG